MLTDTYLSIKMDTYSLTRQANMKFGKRLRDERKKQGLTVQKVALACGTSRSFITLIENGKRMPSKKILPKIAIALNLKTVFVLNWYLEDISIKLQKNLETS